MDILQKRTWAQIDLDAAAHNFKEIRRYVGNRSMVCCVIKADAYGHGAVRMAEEYEALGADWLALSNIEEALQVRRAGIKLPLLVLGYTPAEACRRPGLIPEGIFTHFAVADGGENGKAFTLKQFSCFMALIVELEKQGITFKIHHCANSGAILDYPEMHLDMVRAGVILYGMEPSLSVEHHADFRPVLSLHSVISHVKEIEPGSDISYDRTFTAKERMRVATIPVGYADGYSRRLSNRGSVLIHGTRCPILGKVCMDQCMVDVSAVPQAKVGDTVTLIGRDGEDEITAAEIAGIMETIHYEVVCDISKRVTRVYLKNGKEVSVLDCILDKY